jgi:hypothetical protein
MKKYKAKPLENHLEELNGDPKKKVSKLLSICYIYDSPATEQNIKKYLRTENEPDFEVFREVDEDGNVVKNGVLFYWQTPIYAEVSTVGQFISVATALGRELYWEEETYRNYIYINTKY